ncbi:chromatin regulatory protein sir2 [Histoplasma capsulatum G186AR]|uniref:Chromatin regulatory protein sir2 n=1 Tax=Ajellomyces capsulatus TaxID=5037 RepID=A0A8H7YYU7_AJECA|nr:chromatin regulatory protein sir2 [Histoplasma capsulatum]QSS67753.1 chromatin regulatory protein sir2 [Histoplasma capsulatum G186AR]
MDVAPVLAKEELPLKSAVVKVVDVATENGVISAGAPDVSEDVSNPEFDTEDGDSGASGDSEDSDDNWETESLYEDSLQFVRDDQLHDVPDACTPEEAAAFRGRLHEIGKAAFIEETIGQGTITARKLCTAFGIMPPTFLEGAPDRAYHTLLIIGIAREYSRRVKLSQYNTIDDAVELLKKSKNIIVLTGAGISTSLGIPDFRSKDTGLYSKLEYLGLTDPQEVFDIRLFHEDPKIFFSIAKDILPKEKIFSPTHAFIRLLQDKGKLLTNFTQNIDNLEANAGILPENLIQCHGSFATASCIKCKYQVPGEQIFEHVRKGALPECAACKDLLAAQPCGMKRKRSSNGSIKKSRKREDFDDSSEGEDYEIPTPGVMKPDITFFGEDLPSAFSQRLINHDRELADLVIVIGTSLKVAPVAEVPGILPRDVPQILISRDPVSHIDFDIDMLGECDVVVSELCRRAGWDLQHEMIPKDLTVEVSLSEGYVSRYRFTAVKP